MTRHAVIEHKSREVVNIIVWEGAEWLPPRGHYVVKSDVADIGDFWDEKSGEFKRPEQKE